jgi:hypothetical protein
VPGGERNQGKTKGRQGTYLTHTQPYYRQPKAESTSTPEERFCRSALALITKACLAMSISQPEIDFERKERGKENGESAGGMVSSGEREVRRWFARKTDSHTLPTPAFRTAQVP